jgi:dolichol-phosphate mannosyltransferase
MTVLDSAISIVIPMYNEADNVGPLLNEVCLAVKDFSAVEIIVVDDGSTDDTKSRLQQIQAKISFLTVVRHRANFGQSASVVTGVRKAKYPWIVTLDGDGQNDPADIPLLFAQLKKITNNTSLLLIVGNRKKRQDNWLRLVSTRIANSVRAKLLQDDCPDTGCGLKIFPRDAFLALPHFNHVHRFLPALFKRAGGQVINIPVNHRPRLRGQSKYGVMNRLWVGIVDLFGVVWLLRRPCQPEVESE